MQVICVGDKTVTFSQVVLEVMRHLEGAYALIFKSAHYPNELIACKRGSPLLLGVKVSCVWLSCKSCLIRLLVEVDKYHLRIFLYDFAPSHKSVLTV